MLTLRSYKLIHQPGDRPRSENDHKLMQWSNPNPDHTLLIQVCQVVWFPFEGKWHSQLGKQ
jgi:hypothetical protein